MQKVLKGLKMHRVHGALSKVTETRKKCMPFEGTFDFWVLLGITLMNLTAVGIGIYRLGFEDDDVGRLGRKRQALFSVKGCQSQNVQLIALVFAFIEATPGLLFIMCAPPLPLYPSFHCSHLYISTAPVAEPVHRCCCQIERVYVSLAHRDGACVQVHVCGGKGSVGDEDLGASPHRNCLYPVHSH